MSFVQSGVSSCQRPCKTSRENDVHGMAKELDSLIGLCVLDLVTRTINLCTMFTNNFWKVKSIKTYIKLYIHVNMSISKFVT